jgi:ribonuclease J
MKFKIHRGSKEIGGSCVEVWSVTTRILIDFGMPLVEKDGKDFDFNKYKDLSVPDLITNGILPDINGLYNNSDNLVAGVVFSHPHQDHFGLSSYINNGVKYFLGEATHKIIQLNNIFTSQDIQINNFTYFERNSPFKIGDITITPYWADHSAFDAYSFLVEADGKSIFYSGDFRSHGRKANAFKWFTHNAPQNVDYLLIEGTNIGKDSKPSKTESEIEFDFANAFKKKDKINLIYTSGQNIDRLVSIYRACLRTNKMLVVDVYVAKILKELSIFAQIPYPSVEFKNLKVMYPRYTSNRLGREGNETILYEFTDFKITKEEISAQADKIVMLVRTSMEDDLERITGIEGGNIIYSMWEGYLTKPATKKFIDYLTNRKLELIKIHTSGHADTDALIQMVNALKPKYVVPIHTFNASEYANVFSYPICIINDGEIKQV